MSAHEAGWHEHLAGLRATHESREQGGDVQAEEALASATAGPRVVGNFTLYPASQGTMWTLRRVAKEFEDYAAIHGIPASGDEENPGTRELIELGLSTLVFCDARGTWVNLEKGLLESLIVRADQLMWNTPIDVQVQLQNFFEEQMEIIGNLSDDGEPAEKKPESETVKTSPGTSPETPIQPPAAESPAVSGSPQSTT